MEIIRPDTHIDFVGQSRYMAAVSMVLFVVAIALFFFRGFELGIDFAGGTVIQVKLPPEAGSADEGSIRSAVSALGFSNAVIQRFGPAEDRSFLINVPVSLAERKTLETDIIDGLSESLGGTVSRERSAAVGPRGGRERRGDGLPALLVAWGLILIYVWFRFDLRFAPGAVVALIHDVTLTAGVFVAFGLEFNLQVLAALLVVIGYSLNDTIVVYDRIRENLELRGVTHLEDVVNTSVNQTLSRTLLTSVTTLLVVAALLVLGGPVLRDFSLALLLGITVGTYSTIYVASAMLIFLERRRSPARPAG